MRRTRLVLLFVGLLALGLGGTALAAKGHGHGARIAAAAPAGDHHGGPGDDLAAAAAYLGTTTEALVTQLQSGKTLAQIAAATSGRSRDGLVAALVAHEKQELADAVKAGKLTQAQADQISSMLAQRVGDLVDGTRPAGGMRGMHGDGMHRGGLQAAATYLGIPADSLATQLRSGKTLAQIANATSGKSAAGLIDALVADATKRLGANAPSDLRQDITDLVNGVRPAFGGGPHPGGPGPWGGPPMEHGSRA